MMYGRHIVQSSNILAHFGFAPHQLSGVLQTRTDKPVFFVKPHSLPIVPSHVLWRVLASAPVPSTDKLSPSPPPKVELPGIKWTAPPLPEIKALTEEPASLKHFTRLSSKPTLKCSRNSSSTNTNDRTVVKNSLSNVDADEDVPQTHQPLKMSRENSAPLSAKILHLSFDLLAGFRGPKGTMTAQDWLNRCLLLEIIAGVSGMVKGAVRHLHSLRPLKDGDGGIHTMLEETENERMHMSIFMKMKQPGSIFQLTVLAAQGLLLPAFFLTHLVSPRTCTRLENFLKEETIKTYTHLLDDMEHGHLDEWCTMTAPLIGRNYYNLPDDAKVYDMIKCIRADEANRRNVNHTLSSLDQKSNPLYQSALKGTHN